MLHLAGGVAPTASTQRASLPLLSTQASPSSTSSCHRPYLESPEHPAPPRLRNRDSPVPSLSFPFRVGGSPQHYPLICHTWTLSLTCATVLRSRVCTAPATLFRFSRILQILLSFLPLVITSTGQGPLPLGRGGVEGLGTGTPPGPQSTPRH